MSQPRFLVAAMATLLMGAMATSATAQVVRIEEDWALHVVQPDEQIDAPQVTTMMLPGGDASDLLFELNLNHASASDYSAGGLQLRIAYDDTTLSQKRELAGQRLTHTAENVTWTQVVEKVPDGFRFKVIQGHSASWGSFGGASSAVSVSEAEAGITSLANYRVLDSLQNSGVNYAANRVGWLKLKEVRVIMQNGVVVTHSVNTDVN